MKCSHFLKKLLSGEDQNLSNAIAMILIGVYAANAGLVLVLRLGVPLFCVSFFSKGLIFIALLFCIRVIWKRIDRTLICMGLIVAFVPVVQRLLFPSTWKQFLDTYQTFVFTILPGMICFAVLRDYALCFKRMLTASAVISAINLLIILIWGGAAFDKYSMGYANALILPTNILIWYAVKAAQNWKMRLITLVFTVTNLLGIFVYGSRGAIASIAVFCAYLFFKIPLKHKYGKQIKLGITIIVALLLVFYQPILKALIHVFDTFGFYSRTLMLLVSDLGHDSGRLELWGKIWEDILSNPLAVRGMNADYQVIGIYSHNAILEAVHALGILLGGAVCFFAGKGIIKTLIGKTDDYGVVRILILFCFFPMCLWSGSVWTSMYLWFWIAISIRQKKQQRDPAVSKAQALTVF